MIAMAIIGTAVFLIPQFLSIYNPRTLTVKRTCESYAQSIISVVQEETTYKDILQWIDNPNIRGIVSPAFGTNPRAIQTSTQYWTPAANYTISSSPLGGQENTGARLNNAALIQGVMRTLGAIYNTTVAVRCAFGAYDPLTTAVAAPEVMRIYNPNVRVSIEPYNTTTNVNDCTATFKMSVPKSLAITPTVNAYAADSADTNVSSIEAIPDPKIANPTMDMNNFTMANTRDGNQNLGFRLRVRVNYTNDDGAQQCEVSQKFEYPIDNTRPDAPTVTILQNTSTLPSQDNCVAPATKNAQLRIGYTVAPERGTVLLCRDLSYIQHRWPDATGFNATYTGHAGACVSSSGTVAPTGNPNRHVFPRTDAAAYVPLTRPNWDPGYRDFTDRQNTWVPCDRLALCDVTPTTASSTYTAISMTLQYDSLPVGCILNVEAVGVDSAGNRSLATASSLSSDPVGIPEGTIIFPPTCGNSQTCTTGGATCTSIGKSNFSGTSGYYIPRRGVFCKPTADIAHDVSNAGNLAIANTQPNATFHWSTNWDGTPSATNWRTVFPHGYYTCRGAAGFGATGGAGGSGPNGCCWDPPGSSTCTPYN